MVQCLLLVDVQERYRDSAGPEFCAAVAEALARARAAGMPVVHVYHDIQASDLTAHNPRLAWVAETNQRGFGQNHTVPLPCGWPAVGERVVMKRAFDSFYKTGLHRLLRELNVDHVNVCGLLTGMCVLSTTLSGFSRGFVMRLLADASDDGARRYGKVVNFVYPDVAHVTTVARGLPPVEGAGPDVQRQDLNRHRQAILSADGEQDFKRPTSCALVVLNGSADFLPPKDQQDLQQLERDFQAAGGLVFRVQTETDPEQGPGVAFERLFGRQLQTQTRDPQAIQIPSHGVFDGPRGERLTDQLHDRDIGRVALAGCISAVQVLQAVLDAFNRRYAVVVVHDRVYDPTPKRRAARILHTCYENQLFDSVSACSVNDLVADRLGLIG